MNRESPFYDPPTWPDFLFYFVLPVFIGLVWIVEAGR